MQKYFDLFDKQEGVLGKHGRRYVRCRGVIGSDFEGAVHVVDLCLLFCCSIAFAQIPIEYNLRLNEDKKYPAFLHGKLKIVHSRGLIDKARTFVEGGFDLANELAQGRQNCSGASSSPETADLCVCRMLNEVTTPRLVDFTKGIVAAIDPRHPTRGIQPYRQHFTQG